MYNYRQFCSRSEILLGWEVEQSGGEASGGCEAPPGPRLGRQGEGEQHQAEHGRAPHLDITVLLHLLFTQQY